MKISIMNRRRLKRELRKQTGILIKDRQDSIISIGFYEGIDDYMFPGIKLDSEAAKLVDSLYFVTFCGEAVEHESHIYDFSLVNNHIGHLMNYSMFVKFKDKSSTAKFKLTYT